MLFADAMAIVLAFPCCIQNHHHHTHFSYYLSASYQVGPFIVVFNFQHRFVLRLTLHKQTIMIGSQIILYLNIIYRHIRIVHLNSISVHIRIIKMFTGMITFVLIRLCCLVLLLSRWHYYLHHTFLFYIHSYFNVNVKLCLVY
jgi:hypothetical protein